MYWQICSGFYIQVYHAVKYLIFIKIVLNDFHEYHGLDVHVKHQTYLFWLGF